VFHEEEEYFRQILFMNPGKPLLARSQRASRPQFEQREHLCQGAAVFSQDDAETTDRHPDTQCPGGQGLPLPVGGQLGEKIRTRRIAFRQYLIPVEAVITHGGGAEETLSLPVAPSQGLHQMAGGENAAGAELLLHGVGPAAEDGRPGQIDHRIVVPNPVLPEAALRGIAYHHLRTHGNGPAGFPGTGENPDLMTVRQEGPGEVGADETCAAGHKYLHKSSFFMRLWSSCLFVISVGNPLQQLVAPGPEHQDLRLGVDEEFLEMGMPRQQTGRDLSALLRFLHLFHHPGDGKGLGPGPVFFPNLGPGIDKETDIAVSLDVF